MIGDETPVQVGLMDSERARTMATLRMLHLPLPRRIGRTLLRTAIAAAVSAVVTLTPLMHLFGILGFLIAVPLVAVLTFRKSVMVVGNQSLSCPKCGAPVAVKNKQGGWPVRLHCDGCGASVVASDARKSGGAQD